MKTECEIGSLLQYAPSRARKYKQTKEMKGLQLGLPSEFIVIPSSEEIYRFSRQWVFTFGPFDFYY
jgi:hypothetical protein